MQIKPLKTEILKKTKKFTFFGKKGQKKNATQSHVALHVSSAKLSKLPQIKTEGLSYAGRHLMLLIQHAVDEKKVHVPEQKLVSWDALTSVNPDFLEKKKHIKVLCNVHHFSPRELEIIANRVSEFVSDQPH